MAIVGIIAEPDSRLAAGRGVSMAERARVLTTCLRLAGLVNAESFSTVAGIIANVTLEPGWIWLRKRAANLELALASAASGVTARRTVPCVAWEVGVEARGGGLGWWGQESAKMRQPPGASCQWRARGP